MTYYIDEDHKGINVRTHNGGRVLLIRVEDGKPTHVATSSYVPMDLRQARMFLRTCLEAVDAAVEQL